MQTAPSFNLPIVLEKAEVERALSPELRSKIKKYILAVAQNNRIQCSGAIAIAKSLGANPADVGMVADEMRIKISKCQLGCF